jgi:hypothetical protein
VGGAGTFGLNRALVPDPQAYGLPPVSRIDYDPRNACGEGDHVPLTEAIDRPRTADVPAFISRWTGSGGAERANYVMFLTEFCSILGVEPPHPAGSGNEAYVFERAVTFHHPDGSTSTGRIDLYKRGCFVLEAKQGSDHKDAETLPLFGGPSAAAAKARKGTAVRGTRGWDAAMIAARGQAERYAKELPVEEGWPPFLVVVDVGHVIELFADFSRTGKHYTHFPDANSFRIKLDDLSNPDIAERLRQVWTDPLVLDPTRRSAKVTREIADHLAKLAKSLEAGGHNPKRVATFLMRCLFTMFAEDVDLLPKGCFTALLDSLVVDPAGFSPLAKKLWEEMNVGSEYSTIIRARVKHFNGGLFKDADALPLTAAQLGLLLQAAKADWRDVEPAIFGTLLERALDPKERHKLGAHYTPRAYVERLVLPTVIEPLRDEWTNVMGAAVQRATSGDTAGAVAEIQAFHRRLCDVRVLDPACGTGNFLYVALEHLKRLEGEVLVLLSEMGEIQYLLEMDRHGITPAQFLGIELNPRAAAIADLVLWIGYLQWHVRTKGSATPAEPILRDYKNIANRDAVLDWDRIELVRDDQGHPVSRWDGETTKTHPVTGEAVPDDSARVEVVRYIGPKPAKWPKADFVVGNPPFIGNKRMRLALGDGYAEALRAAHSEVPDNSDFVMYWWDLAAKLARSKKIRRFGFITTNSVTQAFNRRVIQKYLVGKAPLSLQFAIPDHPWVDASDGAAVRVAMSAAGLKAGQGLLMRVQAEQDVGADAIKVVLVPRQGTIHADLTIGADVTAALPLRANDKLSSPGVKLHGAGFIVTPDEAISLGLGRVPGLDKHILAYRNGRDLTATPRGVMVIDLFGLTDYDVRQKFPEVYQWVLERVKPERDQNNEEYRRVNWWLFGRKNTELRNALSGLPRYIATVVTAKHRIFQFLDTAIRPDDALVNIGTSDPWHIGILSSRIHVTWALATGGTLEDRPRYNKSVCFDPFPFPAPSDDQKARIRALGEELDAFRKTRQAAHSDLTITGMYNVLEKLRVGQVLAAKDRAIHDAGLVSVLKDIHDRLDAAVFDAYGWPSTLSDDEILERLVALNRERAAEEKRGTIRWLRPEYQAPQAAAAPVQEELAGLAPVAAPVAAGTKQPWPKTLPEQVQAVRTALAGLATPMDSTSIARLFKSARSDRVEEVLRTLVFLGQARETETGKYAG